jgi:hypothetical protein
MTPGSPRARFLLTAVAVVCASTIWSPRPQVLSLLLLAVTVSLLRSRRYVWLPLVFLLWANLHGAVIMGFVVLGAALVVAAVENRQHARALAIAAACCLLTTVLTPLGVAFWTEIPRSLGRIRQLGIAEWAPPHLSTASLIPFWLMAAALLGLIVVRSREWVRNLPQRQPVDVTVCACALALLPLALTAERNVPSFLLLAVPAIAVLSRFRSAGEESRAARAAQRPRLNGAIAVVAAVLVTGGVAYAYATPADHLRWAPLPEASLTALRACHGNLYNRYDEGGYLIWFAPDHKVFLDGRQDPYPVDLVKRQVRAESSGDFAPLFRQYDIRCAYVPADSLIGARLAEAGWKTLFRDARWAVLAD